jgi:hypothetical protein
VTTTIDEYAARLVATAPPPTGEQLAVLRGLLGPALAAARGRRAAG